MSLTTDSLRWCDTCVAYGDHHTDRHDHVVNGVALQETYRVNGIEHAVREGMLMRKVDEQWVPVRQSKAKRKMFWQR